MIAEPKCFKRKCVHFIGVLQKNGKEQTEYLACRAYPNGIPEDIAFGDDLHKTVRKDQSNNLIYKKS